MAVFNVVHLTDLHFGAAPDRTNVFQTATIRRKFGSSRRMTWAMPATQDSEIAERVASWVRIQAELLENTGDALDALILSGDLATTGLQGDLEAALQYIEAPPVNLHFRAAAAGEDDQGLQLATIGGFTRNCFLVPGNHDRYKNNKGDAGGTLFDTIFANYWGANTDGVIVSIIEKPASPTDPEALERLALVGADVCFNRRSKKTFPRHRRCLGDPFSAPR